MFENRSNFGFGGFVWFSYDWNNTPFRIIFESTNWHFVSFHTTISDQQLFPLCYINILITSLHLTFFSIVVSYKHFSVFVCPETVQIYQNTDDCVTLTTVMKERNVTYYDRITSRTIQNNNSDNFNWIFSVLIWLLKQGVTVSLR